MPSIQDVADQINARLDLVTTHTANTAQNTADTLAVSQDIRSELVQAPKELRTRSDVYPPASWAVATVVGSSL